LFFFQKNILLILPISRTLNVEKISLGRLYISNKQILNIIEDEG